MPLEVAQQAITKYFANTSLDDEVEIHFHGGEPFIAGELLQQVCEWTWAQTWQVPFICFATTNGTLISGAIKAWAEKNRKRLYLGLSLDGTREMHNLNRSNSFDLIDTDYFLKNWPDQPVKMTVSENSLYHLAEGMTYLHMRGFQIMSNFSYGTDWSAHKNIDELTRQLHKLVDFYLEHPEYAPCEFLDMPIELINSTATVPSKWCGVGTDMVAVDVDGKEYPCHLFLPLASGRDIQADLSIDWNDAVALQDARCQNCVITKICPTCYGANMIENRHPALRDPNLCVLTKVRALASSYFQASLLTKPQTPVPENMGDAATAFEKIRAIDAIQAGLTF